MNSKVQRCLVTFWLLLIQVAHDVTTLQGDVINSYSEPKDLIRRDLLGSDYSMFGARSSCKTSGCCGQKVDNLRKECAIVVPFIAALLSYVFAYGISKYVSSTTTCSATVTTSKTLAMIQFTTLTGTLTRTTSVPQIVTTTATSTVYSPSLMFDTATVTNTLTTTPTYYDVATVMKDEMVDVTFVTCMIGRRSLKDYDDLLEEGDTTSDNSNTAENSTANVWNSEAFRIVNVDPSFHDILDRYESKDETDLDSE